MRCSFSVLVSKSLIALLSPIIVSISLACDVKPSIMLDGADVIFAVDTKFELDPEHSYIAVFGDLQTYTMGRFIEYYQKSCEWIRGQYDSGIRICSILAVGDITQNNTPEQWLAFKTASDTVSSVIPFYVCPGNHDYSWSSSKIYDRSNTRINAFAHFPITDEGIIEYYEDNDLSNYVAKTNVRPNLLLLSLEFAPREDVLDWATDYVEKNPDKGFILMTHEWLTGDGERVVSDSDSELQLEGYSSYTLPEYIWRQLVSPNNNILCVLCGHNGFSASNFTTNEFGRPVPQILFNLQSVTHGGSGLIQILEFESDYSTVNVFIYDTINNRVYDSDVASFPYAF